MKYLRATYMILATILLAPLIVLFEFIFLGVCIWTCCQVDEPEKALHMWFGYLKRGIDNNLDFIRNGL